MHLQKFNTPIGKIKQQANVTRIETVRALLRQRHTQTEIAEIMGMSNSALSDFMSYHGLRRPK